MADVFELNAKQRQEQGTGAARRMRRLQNEIPAIVYGASKTPEMLTLSHKEIMHALEKPGFSKHIINLKLASGPQQSVVIKAIQKHPVKPRIMHVDFMRVSAESKISMSVPIHCVNEDKAPGVQEGGVISHIMNECAIHCLPKNLPEYIEVDLSGLQMGHSLHLSDLKLPKGVELVGAGEQGGEHDQPIVSIHAAKVAKESKEAKETEEVSEPTEAKPASAAGEQSEPEVS